MFTGLVAGTGLVRALERRGAETRLRIEAAFLGDLAQGESVAVSGACLTVETSGPGWFTAYASAETMAVTTLGGLRVGSQVNLERALALGTRLGGHLVSGHVDGRSEVVSATPVGQSRIFRLAFPAALGPEVVPKGSVALDGVSLTVNACGDDWLEVNVIPETLARTTAGGWALGRAVNMETDLIGKYVRRMLAAWTGAAAPQAGPASGPGTAGLDESFLKKHGF